MSSRVSLAAPLLAALLLAALSGCGFQPLYADGRANPTIAALSAVEIAPIPERTGQVLMHALERDIGGGAPLYRLDVTLDETIEPFGIRSDESATRQRVTLAATYALVDLSTDKPVLTGTARSDVGIDRVRSEFATVTAEQAALDRNALQVARQIQLRLALYFRNNGQRP
jgi:LPS-assembly lipoprotein